MLSGTGNCSYPSPPADGLFVVSWIYDYGLLDEFAIFTMDAYQKGREEVIARHQQDMLELSTPVVELWQNVLALPVIGTLDSLRAQALMENLLNRLAETGASMLLSDG